MSQMEKMKRYNVRCAGGCFSLKSSVKATIRSGFSVMLAVKKRTAAAVRTIKSS